MSILSALKTKGAKGNNIEEAVKTLPIGGGSGDGAFFVTIAFNEHGQFYSDKTYAEIKQAYNSKVPIYVRANVAQSDGSVDEFTVPCVEYKLHDIDSDGEDKIKFQVTNITSTNSSDYMTVATAIIGIDYVGGEPQEEALDVDIISIPLGGEQS